MSLDGLLDWLSSVLKWVFESLASFFSLTGTNLGRELLVHIFALQVHITVLLKMPKNVWILLLEFVGLLGTIAVLEDRYFKNIPRAAAPEVITAVRAGAFIVLMTLLFNKFPLDLSFLKKQPQKQSSPPGK
jgi:hypothetical protein